MVALISGAGAGLERSSAWILGSRGQVGSAGLGHFGGNVYVNAANGNLVIRNQDEMLIGRGPDAVVNRTYNSLGDIDGDNNDGWRMSVYRGVQLVSGTINAAGSIVKRTDWDGSEQTYTWVTGVGYRSYDGPESYDTLSYAAGPVSGEGTWTWIDGKSRAQETYIAKDATQLGQIAWVKTQTDVDGNTLTFDYDYTLQRMTRVTTASSPTSALTTPGNEYITFSYTGGNLTEITTYYQADTDSDYEVVKRIGYGYDTQGRLSLVSVDLDPSAAGGASFDTTYTYDDRLINDVMVYSDRVASITHPDGQALLVEYTDVGGNWRVTKLTESASATETRITTYSYDTVSRITTMTDANGQLTLVTYDTKGQMTRIDYPTSHPGAGAEYRTFTYNATTGDVIQVRQSASVITNFAYDPNGNVKTEWDQLGNTIGRTYDLATNALLTETIYLVPNPDIPGGTGEPRTTRFTYDSENHLRYVVTADGHVTAYGYNAVGQQTSVRQYVANVYDLSGLGVADTISETTLDAWTAAISDKSRSMLTEAFYDFRGNLTETNQYEKLLTDGSVDTAGQVSRTLYVYDQAGRLLTRQKLVAGAKPGDTQLATESFLYDGMNRLLAHTDFAGFVTSVAYDDDENGGTGATTVFTLGGTVTRTQVFNRAGELVSQAEAAPGALTATTGYRYDSMGRLRVVTNSAGVKTYYLYDNIGRKVAEVQADGSVTEFGYNVSDSLIKTVRYKNPTANLALLEDFSKTLADVRPTADNTNDAWEWRIYDTMQRLVQTIDGAGAVTNYVYDGASRLISVTRIAAAIASGTVNTYKTSAPTTVRPFTADATKDRLQRNFYDGDGRLVGVLDGEGYLTEIVYDGAGRETQTIRYATQSTSPTLATDTFATLRTAAIEPWNKADIKSYRLYDGRGFLSAVIDGDGNLTRYRYTPLGDVDEMVRGEMLTPAQIAGLPTLPATATGPGIETTTYLRNAFGQVTREWQALPDGRYRLTLYKYDSFRRLIDKTTGVGLSPALTPTVTTMPPSLLIPPSGVTLYQMTTTGSYTGSAVDDAIRGTAGNDTITGGVGNDWLSGEGGNDRLIGSQNNDILIGGIGNDTISGSPGNDTYVFIRGGGADIVTDFTTGDKLDISAFGTYASLAQVGANTLITFDDGSTVTLNNVTATNLTANDFIFGPAQVAEGRTSSWRYDGRGLLIGELSGEGSAALAALVNPTGSEIDAIYRQYGVTYVYGAGDRLVARVDADGVNGAGNKTLYYYNSDGDLRFAVNALGEVVEYRYDTLGRRTDIIDYASAINVSGLTGGDITSGFLTLIDGIDNVPANDAKVSTAYNVTGTVAQTTDALGATTTYAYNSFRELLNSTSQLTAADSVKTEFTYDRRGLLKTQIEDSVAGGLQLLTSYVLDAFGRVTSVTDARNNTRTSTYDHTGHVLKTYDAYNNVTEYTYDPLGRVTSMKDRLGKTTTWTHNAFDQTLVVNTPEGVTTTTVQNIHGEVFTVTDDAGAVTTYAYDRDGNLKTVTDPAGVQTNSYDTAGQLIETIDAAGVKTTFSYDPLGRVSQRVIDPGGLNITTLYGFDHATRSATVTDPNGSVTKIEYDLNGQQKAVIVDFAGLGLRTEYLYDKGGRLTDVIEAAGTAQATTTRNVYDRLDRLTSSTTDFGGLGLTTSYVYDANGNVVIATDPTGAKTYFIYDKEDRLTHTVDPVGVVTQTTYDAEGQATGSRIFAATMTIVTPPTQPLVLADITVTTSAADYVTYSYYDADGRQIYAIDAGGAVTRITYDSVGRVAAQQTFATRHTGSTAPTLTALNAWTTTAQDRVSYLVYDAAGRVAYAIDAAKTVTGYAYDGNSAVTLQRTYASAFNGTLPPTLATVQAWATAVGAETGSRVVRSVYDKAGRLAFSIDSFDVVDGRGLVTGYTYDQAGQVTKARVFKTYATTFTLTALQALATTAEDRISYAVFDAAGRQTWSVDPTGAATRFTYDDAGNVTKVQQYATLFTGTDTTTLGALATSADDRVSYAMYDAAGRQIWSVDPTGAVIAFTYDKNGNVTAQRAYATAWTSPSDPTTATLGSLATTTSDRLSYAVYDASGRQTWSVDPLKQAIKFDYDALGNVVGRRQYKNVYTGTLPPTAANVTPPTTHADDRVTSATFDAAGRQIYAVAADQSVTGFTYDTFGQVIATRQFAALGSTTPDAADRVTRFVYDSAGRQAYLLDAAGYVSESRYNSFGQLVQQIRYDNAPISVPALPTLAELQGLIVPNAAKDASSSFVYDLAGRVTDSYDAEGVRTQFVRSVFGDVTSRTVAFGSTAPDDASTTVYTYDKLGRVLTETRGSAMAEASTTTFVYSTFGDLTSTGITSDGVARSTIRTYDKAGRVLKTTVALAGSDVAETTNQYDAFGNLVKVTDPRGGIGLFYYDLLDRVVLQLDPETLATSFEYSLGGEVTKITRHVTAVAGAVVGTKPTVAANAADAVTTMTRDKLDRVLSILDAVQADKAVGSQKFELYEWNAFGDRTKVTNKLGAVTDYEYDKRGLLVSETLPLASINGTLDRVINKFAYDSRGNRTQMIEAFGRAEARTTTYGYDRLDRLTSETGDTVDVLGSDLVTVTTTGAPTKTITYDRRGNIIASTENGVRTLYYYDDLDRKIAQIDALGGYTAWTYDDAGNVLTARAYTTALATLPTTPGGAPPAATSPTLFRETSYTYDLNNRQLTATITGQTTGEYNGTAFTITSNGSIVTETRYDAAGNVVQLIDGRGSTTTFFYDKLGRKVAQIDQENYLTTYQLDAEGNVTREQRYAAKVTAAYTTDTPAADLTSGLSATDSRITVFTYDKNGNRLTQTRLGVVNYVIDPATGLLSLRSTGDGQDARITYSYDALGQVLQKQESNGDTSNFEYDALGRLTRSQGATFTDYNGDTATRRTTDNTYDALGNILKVREGKATADTAVDRVTTYAYDYGSGGRLLSMSNKISSTETFTRSFSYDLSGRVVLEQYDRKRSDGTTVTEGSTYQYDLLGRVSQQAAVTKTSPTVWTYSDRTHVRYNILGEITGRGITAGDVTTATYQETFEYNSAGKVWRTNSGDGVVKLIVYDKTGNATLTVSPNGTSDYTTYANINTAITAISSNAFTGVTYSSAVNPNVTVYDRRGQVIETRATFREYGTAATERDTVSRLKTYNAFGEVTSETSANGATYITSYTYNTLGKLVKKESPYVDVTGENGVTTSQRPTEQYYYDASGRLIGVKDANDNLNSRLLLAGSGHGDDQAVILKEYHAGGIDEFDANPTGAARNGSTLAKVDVFGQQRRLYDESHVQLGTTTDPYDAYLRTDYDLMGRVTSVTHARRTALVEGLIDYYSYDGLGQRLGHWNSALGSSYVERTDYDLQGRLVSSIDYMGYATTFSYVFDGAKATAGMGTYGAWIKTTTVPAGYYATETQDYFGRVVQRTNYASTDLPNAKYYTFTYNKAGRLITQSLDQDGTGSPVVVINYHTITYTYFNTGLLRQSSGDDYGTLDPLKIARFEYDLEGNRVQEDYYDQPTSGGVVYHQRALATFDALNRMLSYTDTANYSLGGPSPKLTYKYDAIGNVRNVVSIGYGNVTLSNSWYAYDSMNRMVIVEGEQSGSTITRGADGTQITYDINGRRKTVTKRADVRWSFTGDWAPIIFETYDYTADGYLATVRSKQTSQYFPTTFGTEQLRVRETRDAMGRVTLHEEFRDGEEIIPIYARTAAYDANSQVTSDETRLYKDGGIYRSTTTYDYLAETAPGVYDGVYNGQATHSYTYNYEGGSGNTLKTTVDTKFTWIYFNAESIRQNGQTSTVYNPNGTVKEYQSSYRSYDDYGQIYQAVVNDGSPRTVEYTTTTTGKILSREETINSNPNADHPKEFFFYYNDIRIAESGNNGPLEADYVTTVNQRNKNGSVPWRWGGTMAYADYDQGFTSVSPSSSGSTDTRYTATEGDTLQSVARSVWGDGSLWYLIAEANGLNSSSQLSTGMSLIIPAKVANFHNSSDTFLPYDPNRAIGNLQPSVPKPSGKKGCGVFGQVMSVIIAVVSSMIFGPIVGNLVSQGIGMATGLQDGFNWKSFGMAVVTAGVNKFLQPVLASVSGFAQGTAAAAGASTGVANAIGQGVGVMASSAISQGIGVALGLQDRMDWVGIAAAGVSAGVSGWVGGKLPSSMPAAGADFTVRMAGGLAGAATRSLLDGSDFGDNVISALPEIITSTVANEIVRGVMERRYNAAMARAEASGHTTGSNRGGNPEANNGRGAQPVGVPTSQYDSYGELPDVYEGLSFLVDPREESTVRPGGGTDGGPPEVRVVRGGKEGPTRILLKYGDDTIVLLDADKSELGERRFFEPWVTKDKQPRNLGFALRSVPKNGGVPYARQGTDFFTWDSLRQVGTSGKGYNAEALQMMWDQGAAPSRRNGEGSSQETTAQTETGSTSQAPARPAGEPTGAAPAPAPEARPAPDSGRIGAFGWEPTPNAGTMAHLHQQQADFKELADQNQRENAWMAAPIAVAVAVPMVAAAAGSAAFQGAVAGAGRLYWGVASKMPQITGLAAEIAGGEAGGASLLPHVGGAGAVLTVGNRIAGEAVNTADDAVRGIKALINGLPDLKPLRLVAKRGPKTDPLAPHNATIRAEADKLIAQGNKILAGGGRLKEKLIPTPGGVKAGRRPDILYRDPSGVTKGRNVGKTKADGSPATREQSAMDDLNNAGVETDFVPYDR